MERREVERAIDALVEEQRARCLWFLRRDYRAQSDEDRIAVLTQIQRHGDRAAFVRAGQLKAWLSPHCSDASAGSSATAASPLESATSPEVRR